jgi:hypothetical protein
MHSRFIRALLVLVAIVVALATSSFLKNDDKHMSAERAAMDALRERARSLTHTIAEVRASQVAYVAHGQADTFWMSHVSQLLPRLEQQIAEFDLALTASAAHAAFEAAEAAMENFEKLDTRVQGYVKDGNLLVAADLIFSDGLEATSTAATQVEAAVTAEMQARQAAFAEIRRQQGTIVGGAACGILLVLLMLGFTGIKADTGAQPETAEQLRQLMARDKTLQPPKPVAVAPPPAKTANLSAAARVCTDFARVLEGSQLPSLLERTAAVLDASGIIVWTIDSTGRELRAAMSHGYSDSAMARMKRIPRDAANAVAAAFRAAEMRTVSGDALGNGALVAPLLTADGCVGVLSVEMKGGSERDESSQALAAIFAAQLATLVSPTPAALDKVAAQA